MDTKSLIIEISTKLFQERGYMGVGLNEIIKKCDISKGSFYHHFPTGKEELLIVSEPVRISCSSLYTQIQEIYSNKLVADGFSKETANSIALMMNASIEGGIMLCLTEKASEPLKIISELLPNLLKKF